jgi:hypothetical protein
MERMEFDNGMRILFAGYEAPSELVLAAFWMVLQRMDSGIFTRAIQEAIAGEIYGAPKPADVMKCARKIIADGLKKPSEKEALLLNQLEKDAQKEAEFRYPAVSGSHQFRSEEDLHSYYFWREKNLRDATKELYEEKLNSVEQNILKGIPFIDAVQLEYKKEFILSGEITALLGCVKTIENKKDGENERQ